MAAFQVCARCATRWPVGTRPAVWCPRCHGVLLSPVSAQAPARGRRNFKWVARKPKSKNPQRTPVRTARQVATPKYDQIPRWGLTDRRVDTADEPETRVERWSDAASGLLMLTAALLGVAVVAEGLRYAILLYNRTRLVSPSTLVISDALVLFSQVASIVIGVAAAVASGCWLVTRRRAVFERAGQRDPRSVRSLLIGCLVPVLSLVLPGVYLTELVERKNGPDRDRLLLLVRLWWAMWVVDWILMLLVSIWRTRDSLQARADGVLLAALLCLVAAGVALLTIYLMRSVDELRWRGGRRPDPTRWVVAVPRSRNTERPDADIETDTESGVEHEKASTS